MRKRSRALRISYLATKVANRSRSTSGSVDILSVLRWLENSEHWIGNVTLGNVQFGWEITSSSGGMNFQVNSYWVSFG